MKCQKCEHEEHKTRCVKAISTNDEDIWTLCHCERKVMKMEEIQRIKLINYCIEIGFLVFSVDDWNDSKKIKKIKQYMKQGYRVTLYHQTFEVINIHKKPISINKQKNILALFDWLREDSV